MPKIKRKPGRPKKQKEKPQKIKIIMPRKNPMEREVTLLYAQINMMKKAMDAMDGAIKIFEKFEPAIFDLNDRLTALENKLNPTKKEETPCVESLA